MDNRNWNDERVYFFLKNLGFSNREIDVAKALLVLKTDDEIGTSLHIAAGTAHSHRMKLYSKTGTTDRGGFIKFLYDKGLDRD